jgi:hypothetical protein
MLSPRVCTNAVSAAAILAAFWASPGLSRPKSPIAATLKVCPGFAAVRSIPLLVAVPLVTEYIPGGRAQASECHYVVSDYAGGVGHPMRGD